MASRTAPPSTGLKHSTSRLAPVPSRALRASRLFLLEFVDSLVDGVEDLHELDRRCKIHHSVADRDPTADRSQTPDVRPGIGHEPMLPPLDWAGGVDVLARRLGTEFGGDQPKAASFWAQRVGQRGVTNTGVRWSMSAWNARRPRTAASGAGFGADYPGTLYVGVRSGRLKRDLHTVMAFVGSVRLGAEVAFGLRRRRPDPGGR